MRAFAALAAVAVAAVLVPAGPALAHGAPTTPISRTAACASGGEETGSAVCEAAREANGGALGRFDNLRIADVGGNDKERVPDGELCSGGLKDFRGLDLARTDWPSTTVTAGSTLKMKYAGTIPHEGTFRVYLTRQGYDPESPLAWDDLTAKPIGTFTDPPLTGGSYRMSVKLPEGRTGRHLLYVVWETSSTPDTYYSCSDLVFKAPSTPSAGTSKAPAVKATTSAAAPEATRTPEPSPSTAPAAPDRAQEQPAIQTVATTADDATLGHWIIGGALAVILATLAVAGFTRFRTQGAPRRRP